MRTRMQKGGNGLALRIPKSFATEVGLKQNSTVEISIARGKLIINPVKKPDFTLKQLLAQITEDNLHREIRF